MLVIVKILKHYRLLQIILLVNGQRGYSLKLLGVLL